MNKIVLIPLISLAFLLIDLYAFQGLKWAFNGSSATLQKIVFWTYWSITILTLGGFWFYHFGNPEAFSKHVTTFILLTIFTNYISKTFLVLFVLVDDIQRGARWAWQGLSQLFQGESNQVEKSDNAISRSAFLAKAGVITAAVPVVAIGWGIVSGAHDYRIRRKTVHLPNLPVSMDGIRIGQISDIHSGSFWNRTAVKGGVELLNKEKADLVFFTGDLVNNRATEMNEFMNVFDKIKAPMGVYSIFGNHDYGDYVRWEGANAKSQNLADLARIHGNLGWKLLRNQNEIIKIGSDNLSIIGVENWSNKARFPKYGDLSKAMEGTFDTDLKLLLSHDPSHWKAEVLKRSEHIEMTFSGHTHGMQFGVEIKEFKWSPVQYVYEEWAGLYSENNRHLYVNRGFGYLGYPGRIGIPPELTIIELKRA